MVNSKMNSKTVLIVSCFVLFNALCVKNTAAKKSVPKLYEELDCKEITSSNGLMRFQCPDFSKYAEDKCYVKGKEFDVGSQIFEDLWPDCQPLCRCDRRYMLNTTYILCAHNDCPEFFGLRDSSCIQQYEHVKDCCRSNEYCGKAKIAQLNKCVVDGEEYYPGEKIYPKEDSCYHCLCAEGYNNQTAVSENSHCKRIDCHIEINHGDKIRSGCVPIYETSRCCPFEYKCPDKGDTIDTSTASEFSNDDNYFCKFGTLTLRHGEQLKTNNKCLKCECFIPPFVTCTDKC